MRPSAQRALGVLLVAAAAFALLARAGVVDVSLGHLVRTWWPTVIVLVGVFGLVTAPRAWHGPAVLVLVGVILQSNRLGYPRMSLWELVVPLILLVAGLALITRGVRGPQGDPDVLSSLVIMGASNPRTASPAFRSGVFTAVMGGIEVDLRGAGIVEPAEVSVFTLWGGVEIKVPPTWSVTVRGLPLLGGWEDKTVRPVAPDAPRLVVNVIAIMGGLEVRN